MFTPVQMQFFFCPHLVLVMLCSSVQAINISRRANEGVQKPSAWSRKTIIFKQLVLF